MADPYNVGTATVANGGTAVSGTGTFWVGKVRKNDLFSDPAQGIFARVTADPTENDELTINAWPGSDLSGDAYEIIPTSSSIDISARLRELIFGLSLIDPNYDVQIDELADRDAYDNEPGPTATSRGFAVLVSDIGDGRSAVYSKQSNASGDWSDPAYFSGPTGDAGPYTEITIGPVTTLPAGSPADVDLVVVDPDTVRLDFSLPKGADGAGTIASLVEGEGILIDDTDPANPVISVDPEALPGVGGSGQLVLGGDFATNPWQLGTSFTSSTTPANNDDTYLADMFTLISDGNNVVNVSRDTDLSMKSLVTTASKRFGFVHIVEAKHCAQIIGDVVSAAVRAKASGIATLRMAVLSWTGTADAVTSDVVASWSGTEPTWAANWTREGTVASLTLSSNYQTLKADNIAIDAASAKQVAIVVWIGDTDAALNETLNIKWVSCVPGDEHPDRPPVIDGVEQLCREYLYVMDHDADGFLGNRTAVGLAISTTTADIVLYFLTRMRVIPVGTVYNVGSFQVTNGGGTGLTATAIELNNFRLGSRVRVSVASGLTVGQGSLFRFASSGARLVFDANL